MKAVPAGKLKQAVAAVENMCYKGPSFVTEIGLNLAGDHIDKFLILVSGFG